MVELQDFSIGPSNVFVAERLEKILDSGTERVIFWRNADAYSDVRLAVHKCDNHLIPQTRRLGVPQPIDDRDDIVAYPACHAQVIPSDDIQNVV